MDINHKSNQRIVAIIVVLTTSFTMSLIGSALNLAIPNIGSEFSVSASAVGWMITGYMLTTAALSVPFGRWADITSRKSVVVAGIAVFIIGCAGAVLSVNMPMLLTFRIIQGVGGAMVLSSNTPILLSVYPPKMKGRALGMSIGSVYIGLSLGPVIGGVVNQYLGWRFIFAFAGIVNIIALFTAIFKLDKGASPKEDKKMDYKGSIIFATFVLLLMLGLSMIDTGVTAIFTAAFGLALGFVFVKYEGSIDNPILNLNLFRSNIGYTLSNIAALLNYAATFAISYLLSIYLQIVAGMSSQFAGLVMITQPAVMALLTPIMGRQSDKHSPFVMSSIGMGICGICTLFFAFIGENTPLWAIVCVLIVTGIGFAFFSSPNTNAVMSCVENKDYGVANSILNTMRSLGQTSSMVIVTIVVSFIIPNTQLAQAESAMLVRVINISFAVFTLMCFCGVFISLKRKRD